MNKLNKKDKDLILNIIDFWLKREMLEQEKFPQKPKSENVDVPLRKWQERLSVCDIPQRLATDEEKVKKYKVKGDTINCCFGKVKKNDVVEAFFPNIIEERGEPLFGNYDYIALFSFKLDFEGKYIIGSFSLSPFLWVINNIIMDKNISSNDYAETNEIFDEIINNPESEKSQSERFEDIKDEVIKQFLNNTIPVLDVCHYEYHRYKSEEDKKKDVNPEDCSQLLMDFYSEDLNQIAAAIKADGAFRSPYQKAILEFILSAYKEDVDQTQLDKIVSKRKEFSPNADLDALKQQLSEILDIERYPIGKWPCKYSPALMQQMAINLAIQEGNAPIFSINGPPGSGKTTLLKEIIAHNVVIRAYLLSSYGDADEAFDVHHFQDGMEKNNGYSKFAPAFYSLKNERINEYGILVASSNNTAVENITRELPQAPIKDLPEEDPSVSHTVKELFSKLEDNYFEDLAKNLFQDEDDTSSSTDSYWGLISAPFGKRKNISAYVDKVLRTLAFNKTKPIDYSAAYRTARSNFIKQWDIVVNLRNQLEKECQAVHEWEAHYEGQDPQKVLKESNDELKRISSESKELNVEFLTLKSRRQNFYLIFLDWILGKNTKGRMAALSQVMSNLRKEEEAQTKRKEDAHTMLNLKMKNIVDGTFIKDFHSNDTSKSERVHKLSPWQYFAFDREREKLFFYALQLHKYFVLSSKSLKANFNNFLTALGYNSGVKQNMSLRDLKMSFTTLLQSVFLLTPVISSTFASIGRFLKYVPLDSKLGTLIIDEAGQAVPYYALGALARCRKAIIVGDPKQIEPVVTASDLAYLIDKSEQVRPYNKKDISAQSFADSINPYGRYLGVDEEKIWVGCPLTVHRRCINPMFSISNGLCYDGTMYLGTNPPKKDKESEFILDSSCWIDIQGTEIGNKNHYVKAQAEAVTSLLKIAFKKRNNPNVFIITPFTTVKEGIIKMVNDKFPDHKSWAYTNIGTVHTFQGKESDEVIFLLGCDSSSKGAVQWVNPNLVNVAVTRAKYRLYVIGDVNVWKANPNLKAVINIIPKKFQRTK